MAGPLKSPEIDSLLSALKDAEPDIKEAYPEGEHYTEIELDNKEPVHTEDWYKGFQSGYTYACNQFQGFARGMSDVDVASAIKDINNTAN